MKEIIESVGWIIAILVLATACFYLYKIGKYREFNSPDEKIYDDKLNKK